MTQQQLLNEYAALPAEAQRQVAEFIALLRQKYGADKVAQGAPSIDLATEPFVGMWRDRQDLLDSSAWVRGTRRSEWGAGA